MQSSYGNAGGGSTGSTGNGGNMAAGVGMVGGGTHVPLNHGSSSGSSNFADVLSSSSYNLNISEYNDTPNTGGERRVETLLGHSSLSDEVHYAAGHTHHHSMHHDPDADSIDRRYSNTSNVTNSIHHPHRSNSHQEHHQSSLLTDPDPFPDTFHAEFITQPLEYPMGGGSPPLAVSLLNSASVHVPHGTGASRPCPPPVFSISGGIGGTIKSLNYDEGSHPSETHSHSPPSPSSSPCAAGIPSSPHSPSHILPSFVDTYNLPPAPPSQQHGNITIPSTTILAHRHGQYSPIAQASASQINGGNRTIITTIPRQTTLESRFTTFKTEPNLSPSPQPRGISAENISFGHQQYTQSGQLVTAPSTSPSPYSTNTHPVNILSYQQQQTTGQSNIARGQCNSYEPPSLNFLKKVI